MQIFLDDDGGVTGPTCRSAKLRGFEKFAQGRRADDMPRDHLTYLRRLPHGSPHGRDESP